MRVLAIALLLLTFVPPAHALDPVCVAEADACFVVYSRDEACANAARAVWVESGVLIASAANWCYGEGSSSYGNGVAIEAMRGDGSSSVQVQWYAYGQAGVAFCEMRVAFGGLGLVPNQAQSVPCVAGEPGLIVPALP